MPWNYRKKLPTDVIHYIKNSYDFCTFTLYGTLEYVTHGKSLNKAVKILCTACGKRHQVEVHWAILRYSGSRFVPHSEWNTMIHGRFAGRSCQQSPLSYLADT